MRRLALLLAVVLIAGASAIGGLALADSFQPVTLTTTVLSSAHVGSPLKVRVRVSADPGVLDVRSSPMEIEVRLAPECGATYLSTLGTKIMAKLLSPQPAYGKSYTATAVGSGKPTSRGSQTVCVWLVSAGDQRLFADDDSVQISVAKALPKHRPTHRRRRALVARAADYAPPPIRHVFVIVLENESEQDTFAANPPAPYLAKTMVSEGALLPNYYGIGHESNDNYIAMISGQAPNVLNQADCQTFDNFTASGTAAYGQQKGIGCVYPNDIQTIGGQLDAAGYTWGDFNQSMGNDPLREAAECGHPAVGQKDGTQSETAADAYATRHNPFVYFHSIIDDTELCDTHVVNLSQLPADLSSVARTPNYVFITPDLCGDGHDASCAEKSRPGGFAGINQFLAQWVPQITGSPAFRQNGLLIVTFDEAATSDSSSCCGEIAGPGSPLPGITGSGGGKVGAVLLSPCIKPGTVSQTPYNHYAMLGSIENLFGLSHLGYAGLPGESYFGPDVFTDPSCGRPPQPRPRTVLKLPALLSTLTARPLIRLRPSSSVRGSTITVQVRRSGGWVTLAGRSYRAALGRTYSFRARSTSPSGVVGPWASATTTVPTATRPRGLRLAGRWRYAKLRGAWLGHALIGTAPGASYRFSYTGGAIRVIGARGRGEGVVTFSFDGVRVTRNLRASRRAVRQVLFAAGARRGRHTLIVRVDSGVLGVEALAIDDLR